MFHTVKHVNSQILWANMHMLFWLSLMPFATAWMDENHFATVPTAIYGGVLFMTGVAYFILQGAIVRRQGEKSLLADAIGADWKGKASLVLYLAGIAAAFWKPIVGLALFIAVAMMWLIPDQRIERALARVEGHRHDG